MNRNTVYVVLFVLLALLVGVGALFVIQNGARTTQLSLNLYVAAWELKQPVTITTLMGITAASGFLLGLCPTLWWGSRRASRARQLEREIALSAGGDQDAWRS
jgi:hypothetical protein